MKRILTALAGGLLLGAVAAPYAKLPPLTPEEKAAAAAKAQKDTAGKAKAAKELAQAQDKAVASYRKSKGSSSAGATAQPQPDLMQREAQTEMPKPDQANDHSTTARDPK